MDSCLPDKSDLRRRARAARSTLPPGERRRAAARLAELDLTPLGPWAGRIVAGYRAKPDEIDPLPLLLRLAGAGARLALPVTPPVGRPLSFRAWAPDEPLVPGPFGLSEPAPDAEPVTPDLVLVPCLAFSSAGFRLGYGGGYYDRTLAALRATRPVAAVGLAFAAQETIDLPAGPHDQTLDWILTERGLRPCPGT